MKILDRYILRELVSPGIFGMAIFGSLWMVNILMKMVNLFVTKGVSFQAVCQIFLYSIPTVVVMTAPMASLLAVLLALGRLNGDSELIVMRALTVGFGRILRPIMAAAILVSCLTMAFNEWVVPEANYRREQVFLNEIVLKKPLPKVAKDIFFSAGDQFEMFVRSYDHETEQMENVTVYQFLKQEFPRITEAKEAHLGQDAWTFRQGRTCVLGVGGQVSNEIRFGKWTYPVEMRHAKRIDKRNKTPKEMNMRELLEEIERQKKRHLRTEPLWVEFWFKTAFPFASLFLCLVGAPLAVTSGRASAGLGVGLSIIIMFVYYILLAFGKALGDAGTISPPLGGWLPNLAMAVVAFWLIRRSVR